MGCRSSCWCKLGFRLGRGWGCSLEEQCACVRVCVRACVLRACMRACVFTNLVAGEWRRPSLTLANVLADINLAPC